MEHGKITYEKTLQIIANIRNDTKMIDDLGQFNQSQISVLNAVFMVDEVLTREFRWYKISEVKYKLVRSKGGQKESDIAKSKYHTEVFKQQIEDQEKEIDKELFKKYF